MGKAAVMSLLERQKVDFLHSQGLSNRNIAKQINRSSRTVDRYLKDPAAKIKELAGVKASLSTVQRTIRNAEHLKRLKIKKKPPLNAIRKENRLQFAKEYMTWTIQSHTRLNDWRSVVFTDEKHFNLDGPDGFQYYYHNLRKDELYLSRHHSREGGIMVWGAITFYGTIDLIFIDQKMNGDRFKTLLESVFPKLKDLFGPIPWIFQQDNAPIHNSRVVKSFISSQNVNIMTWPPYSPDLNVIENVWGWLTRKVYEGGKQYEDKETLTADIKRAWSEISLNYIDSLYHSMKDRIYEVITN